MKDQEKWTAETVHHCSILAFVSGTRTLKKAEPSSGSASYFYLYAFH